MQQSRNQPRSTSSNRPAGKQRRSKPRRRKRERNADPDFDALMTSAVGSYGKPVGIPRALEREFESEVSREMNPQLFKEFDALVKELATFFIGLGIIVAVFGVVAHLILNEGARGGLQDIPMPIKITLFSAAAFFVMGVLTLTRVLVIFAILVVLCVAVTLATGIFMVVNYVWLLLPIPIGFFIASQKLLRACRVHP